MKSDHASTNVIDAMMIVMYVLVYKSMPMFQTKQVYPAIVVLLTKEPGEEVTLTLRQGVGDNYFNEG